MRHVAIDLGGRKSQICVRDAQGRILREDNVPTGELPRYLALQEPGSRVVMETCAEAFTVADAACNQGHHVRVVPATLVRSLGVGRRGIKTDVRDARVLSEVSARIDLPSVHIPSQQSRQRKTVCGMRDALVSARTKLINTVRGWLRTRAQRLPTGGSESFTTRLRQAAQRRGEALEPFVERQLWAIDALSEQIAQADLQLSAMAAADPVCQRLMTVPGIGPITAIRYTAAVDQIDRFDDAHHIESYLGLTPGENSSSDKTRRTAITKAGAPALRWTLVQAAWSLRRCRPNDPIVLWSLEVEKRRGKRIAIIAMARKLAGILFAIWRDGSTYQPSRGAATP